MLLDRSFKSAHGGRVFAGHLLHGAYVGQRVRLSEPVTRLVRCVGGRAVYQPGLIPVTLAAQKTVQAEDIPAACPGRW